MVEAANNLASATLPGEMVRPGQVAALTAFSVSNMILYRLLHRHYTEMCAASWWSVFALEPSTYCVLVRRALGILQWAPLVAVGLGVGPIVNVPLFGVA